MGEPRVGYVLKRYPRLSETFILNEILAHEAAGMELHIFSLKHPMETVRHQDVDRVRAGVTRLELGPVATSDFGRTLAQTCDRLDPEDMVLSPERPKQPWHIWRVARIAELANELGITHLHAHFATEAAAAARLAARIAGITYSFTAHAKDIYHEGVDAARVSQLARDASALVTVSDYNIRYLKQHIGDAADNAVRVYNGLDLTEFPRDRSPRDGSLIVAVGRLVEKKGFADLVSACAVLRDRGRSFRCLIVGDGELSDDLAQQIAALGLGDCVELPGAMPREEVRELMCRAGVLAAPCVIGSDGNRDGLPTVLLEAMALGTPCVSTAVTGIPEAIRDDETGLMVPGHDPDALADAIERLLADRALAERLADNARTLVEDRFDLHRNAGELRRVMRGRAYAEAAG